MTASPPAAPNGLPLDLPMGFPAGPAPVISVVVPMRNEGPNVAELVRRTRRHRNARQEAARARDRVAEATDRLSAACADAGFDDVAAVRAAFAPDKQIAAWDTLLQEAASLRAAAEETLADEDVRAAMSTPEPPARPPLQRPVPARRRGPSC